MIPFIDCKIILPENHHIYLSTKMRYSDQLVFILFELILLNSISRKYQDELPNTRQSLFLDPTYIKNFTNYLSQLKMLNSIETMLCNDYWDELVRHKELMHPVNLQYTGATILDHIGKCNSLILNTLRMKFFHSIDSQDPIVYRIVTSLSNKVNKLEKELFDKHIIESICEFYLMLQEPQRIQFLSSDTHGIYRLMYHILTKDNPWSSFDKIEDIQNLSIRYSLLVVLKLILTHNQFDIVKKLSFNSLIGLPLNELSNKVLLPSTNAAIIESNNLPDCYLIIKYFISFKFDHLINRFRFVQSDQQFNTSFNKTANEQKKLELQRIEENIKALFEHISYLYEHFLFPMFEYNIFDDENPFFSDENAFECFIIDSTTFLFSFLKDINYLPDFIKMIYELDRFSTVFQSGDESELKIKLKSGRVCIIKDKIRQFLNEIIQNDNKSIKSIKSKLNKNYFKKIECLKDSNKEGYLLKLLNDQLAKILLSSIDAHQIITQHDPSLDELVDTASGANISKLVDQFIDSYFEDFSQFNRMISRRNSQNGGERGVGSRLTRLSSQNSGSNIQGGNEGYTMIDWRIFNKLVDKITTNRVVNSDYSISIQKLKLFKIYTYTFKYMQQIQHTGKEESYNLVSPPPGGGEPEDEGPKELFQSYGYQQIVEFNRKIEEFKGKIEEIYTDEAFHLSIRCIKTMNESLKYYLELSEYIQFPSDKLKERLDELMIHFQEQSNYRVNKLNILIKYLINPPYSFDLDTSIDINVNHFDDLSINELIKDRQEVLSILESELNVDQDLLDDLLFFITSNSYLFHSISCVFLEYSDNNDLDWILNYLFNTLKLKSIHHLLKSSSSSSRLSTPLKLKKLIQSVECTKLKMKQLSSDISFDHLEKNIILLDGSNLDEEINIICEYITNSSSDSQSLIKRKLENNLKTLKEIVEIKLFVSSLKEFQSFIDMNSIHELVELLNNSSNYKLSELIEKIKLHIGGLDFQQFKYFDKLIKSKKILQLKYFKYDLKKFTQEMEIARNNSASSNNEFGLSILMNLEIAFNLLQPIQDRLKASSISASSTFDFSNPSHNSTNKIPLTELCKEIKKVLEKGTIGLDKKLNSFEEVLKGQCALLSYFSTNASLEDLDFFCNACEKLIENGIYKSRLSLHPKGKLLQFRTRKDKQSPGEKINNLQDIVRALYVFTSGGNDYHQSNHHSISTTNELANHETHENHRKSMYIKEFVGIYPKAIEIHELQLRLELSGHPEYRGIKTIINGDKQLSIQLFDDILKKLQLEVINWENSIKNAYKQYKRLTFLDRAQLANLVNEFSIYFEEFPYHLGVRGDAFRPIAVENPQANVFPPLIGVPIPGLVPIIANYPPLEPLFPHQPQTINEELYKSRILHIDPYIWSCFPGLTTIMKSNEFIHNLLHPIHSQWIKERERIKLFFHQEQQQQEKIVTPVRILNFIGEITEEITRLLVEGNYIEEEEDYMDVEGAGSGNAPLLAPAFSEKPVGYVVEGFTDYDIMKHIYELSEYNQPSYSQILFCDKQSLNLILLKQFLKRIEFFPDLNYFIIHVDVLDVLLREYLLDWLDEQININIVDPQSGGNPKHSFKPIGKLYIYFSTSSCAERYSLLNIHTLNINSVPKELDKRKLTSLKEKNIEKIQFYTSPNGTGKSYEINKILQQYEANNQIFISIYEDFNASQFISLLEAKYDESIYPAVLFPAREQEKRKLAIHIDISCYSPLRIVGRFLELLLCHGYIWDERTGTMLRLYPDKYEYNFYIELHTCPDNEELYSFQSESMSTVLNYIYILNIIAEEIKQINSRLEINDNFVDLIHWWKIYKAGIFDKKTFQKNVLLFKLALDEAIYNNNQEKSRYFNSTSKAEQTKLENEYRIEFYKIQSWLKDEKKVAFPLKIRYQNLFLKYCKARIEWLMIFIDTWIEVEFNGCPELYIYFELLLIEAARLSEEEIGSKLTNNPPLTVFRDYINATATLIYFNNASVSDKQAFKSFYPRCVIATREELLKENGAMLRTNLQSIFNIEKLYEIIANQKYVLTPDFAFKLYFIYERMKARENVMLSGGTGVGKTELLTLYSSIINTDINHTFDIIYNLKCLISSAILPEIRKRNAQLIIPEFPFSEINHIDQMIHYLHMLTNNSLERLKIIAHFITWEIMHKVARYPLLEHKENGFIKRIVSLPAPQPVEWEEDDIIQLPATPVAVPLPKPQKLQENNKIVISNMNQLVLVLKEYSECTFKKVFYTIRMHNGITAEQLRIKVLAIIENAWNIEEIYKNLIKQQKYNEAVMEIQGNTPGNDQVVIKNNKKIQQPSIVVFIDEVNTTSVMGMIKSIFCDKKIDNIQIPDNILWVCAINPFVKTQNTGPMSQEIEKFTGMGTDERIFAVREVPESLKHLSIDFDILTEDQETMFITNLLSVQKVCDNDDQYHSLSKLIIFSQRIVQHFQIHRMQVSIRDIMRTVNLYQFFKKNTCLLGEAVPGTDVSNSIHWQSLIMSIGTSYYLRLDNKKRGVYVNKLKMEMNQMKITDARRNACPIALQNNFEEILRTTMKHLYDNTKIPPGIACTRALLENLWSIVVCCSAMIPLIIIGPPGCSKTLSFSIAIQNMSRGISDNEKTFYNQLPRLDPIRYQCSSQSTDIEIKKRYKEALSRQRLFDADSKDSKSIGELNRCVVFLDEAGLTEDRPLKVVHYYMDHPKVCTVILSNELLDAAKMNRALQVYQNPTSHDDLISLARGSLGIQDEKIIHHLCSAYRQTIMEGNQFTTSLRSKGLFQLRDFIYFLRYIRATAVSKGGFHLTATILLRALQRNFNGITKENFKKLVELWFKELNKARPAANPLQIPMKFTPTIELIRENLDYRIAPNENPNTSAFRFLLIIDPTENETAVSLLYSTNLCRVDHELPLLSLHKSSCIDINEYLFKIKHQPQPHASNQRSGPFISKVKAIRSYNAQGNELSFQFGDEIIVRNDNLHLDGWWQGELTRTGKIGIFPYQLTAIIEVEGQLPTNMNISNFPESEEGVVTTTMMEIIPVPDSNIVRKHIKAYYNPNKTVQICLGDFAMDKTDDEITNAVRKVMDAMRDGKIVILVNSSLIDGSFYDLFNRYFKIVKKHQEEGDDYYANVALGSFSRECKVHKDFKVIIHLPQSKLNNTPLPFLTRFEKYILSTQDVLDDLLLSRPWSKSMKSKKTFIELIKEGCDEFVADIHCNDNHSSLLYGLIPYETVSSLMLESTLYSIHSGREDFPKIKSTIFKHWNKHRGSNHPSSNPSNYQINKSTMEGKIRSLIRKANFKLLQLARPELLYMTTRLQTIPHYLHEYLINQEHFSVFRFLKNLITIHVHEMKEIEDNEELGMNIDLLEQDTEEEYNLLMQEQEDQVDYTGVRRIFEERNQSQDKKDHFINRMNKWCIFTRTSGEFEQLSSRNNLQKLLERTMKKENIQHYSIHTLQLESIKSSKSLMHELSNKINLNKKSLILFTVDMKLCTTSQINLLRRLIDNLSMNHHHQHHSSPDTASSSSSSSNRYAHLCKCLFVLVLHFPAELLLTNQWCYNSIYLHNWEYIYIDSLGFSIEKNQNHSLTKSESKHAANANHQAIHEDPDGRKWIAKAFGLKVNDLSDDVVIEYYKRKSITISKNYINKYKPDVNPPCPIASIQVYSSEYNYNHMNKLSERIKYIEDLLSNENYIFESFIRRFCNSWSKELLNKVISTVCEKLMKGNLYNSFVNTVQNTLDHLLYSNVYQLMEILLKNYQLEHSSLLYNYSKSHFVLPLFTNVPPASSITPATTNPPPPGGESGSADGNGVNNKYEKYQFLWKEIYKKTINLLKPVKLKLIAQIEEKVENNFTLVPEFNYITKTPMFPFIYSTLEKYVDIVFLNHHPLLLSELIQSFIHIIEKNNNLFDLIKSLTKVKVKFLEDLIIKKLSLSFPPNCHYSKFNPTTPNPPSSPAIATGKHETGRNGNKIIYKIIYLMVDKVVNDVIDKDITIHLNNQNQVHNHSNTVMKDSYIILSFFISIRYYYNTLIYIRDFYEPFNNPLFHRLSFRLDDYLPSTAFSSFNISELHNTHSLNDDHSHYLHLLLIKLTIPILYKSLQSVFVPVLPSQPAGDKLDSKEWKEMERNYLIWMKMISSFIYRSEFNHSILSFLHLNKADASNEANPPSSSGNDLLLFELYVKMHCLFLFCRDLDIFHEPECFIKLFSSNTVKEIYLRAIPIPNHILPASNHPGGEQQDTHAWKYTSEIKSELKYMLDCMHVLLNESTLSMNDNENLNYLFKNTILSVFQGRKLFFSTSFCKSNYFENVKILFKIINSEKDVALSPCMNQYIDFDWYLYLLHSFINKKGKLQLNENNQQNNYSHFHEMLIDSLEKLGNEILIAFKSNQLAIQSPGGGGKVTEELGNYKYNYSLLFDDFSKESIQPCSPLEHLFYHFFVKVFENKTIEELLLLNKEIMKIIETEGKEQHVGMEEGAALEQGDAVPSKQQGVGHYSLVDKIKICSIVTLLLKNSNKLMEDGGKKRNFGKDIRKMIRGKHIGSPLRANIYFLQRNYPNTLVILNSKRKLKRYGLDENVWFEEKGENRNNFHLFSFQIENKSERGKLYQELKETIKNAADKKGKILREWISAQLKQGGDRYVYLIRMFLVLILFYEYFNVLKDPPASLEYLFNDKTSIKALKITRSELTAYEFLLQGALPLNQDSYDKDELMRFFSIQIRENGPQKEPSVDLSFCYLLVSVLACCLGTASHTNHFYKSIFELKTLNGMKMPGSAYGGRELYDCGFKMADALVLDLPHSQPIMQNHNRFRLALNGFIWAPFCWHMILNPKTGVEDCKLLYHFLNYIGDSSYGGRNETQRYRSYIVTRYTTFVHVLANDKYMLDRNININLFLVEVLDQLSNVLQSESPIPNGFRAQFHSVDECVAYESNFLNLFQNVMKNYDEIKLEYQNTVIPNSPSDVLIKLQSKQSKIFPKLSAEIIEDEFIKEDKIELIEISKKLTNIIEILPLIPILLSSYHFLTSELSFKLPNDVINSTIEEVMRYCKRPEVISPKAYERLQDEINKLLDAYAIINRIITEFKNECQTTTLPSIGFDSLFSLLISENKEGRKENESYDIILRTVEAIINELNKVFEVIKKKKYREMLNSNQLYYNIANVDRPMDIVSMLQQKDEVITLPNVEDRFEHWLQRLFLLNITIQKHANVPRGNTTTHCIFTEDISLDISNINKQLLKLFHSIKEFIPQTAFASIKKPFYSVDDKMRQIKLCEEAILVNNLDVNIENQTMDDSIDEILEKLNPINQLKYLIKENKIGKEYQMKTSKITISNATLSTIKEDTVKKMAENIVKLVKVLNQLDNEHQINHSDIIHHKIIDQFEKMNILDTPKCELFSKNMCNLQVVAEKILELEYQKPWIFSKVKIPQKIDNKLADLLNKINEQYKLPSMEFNELERLWKITSQLLNLLMCDEVIKKFEYDASAIIKPIHLFLHKQYENNSHSISNKNGNHHTSQEEFPIQFNDFKPFLPDAITFLKYPQFMFWFHRFFGEIDFFYSKLLKENSKNNKDIDNLIDWIPAEFRSTEDGTTSSAPTVAFSMEQAVDDEENEFIEIQLKRITHNLSELPNIDSMEYEESHASSSNKLGLKGINNPGENICWLTSLIQCIAHTNHLHLEIRHLFDKVADFNRKQTISYHLVSIIDQLFDENYVRSYIDASALVERLKIYDPLYSSSEQQDPSEFYSKYISDIIPNELNRLALHDFTARFSLDINTSIRCKSCNKNELKSTENKSTLIGLDIISDSLPFGELLEGYFNNPLPLCSICHREDSAFTQIKLNIPPTTSSTDTNGSIMVIHIKRARIMNEKITSKVNIPLLVEFSKYSNYKTTGTLYAAIIHAGSSSNFGHYFALIRFGSEWFKFSDRLVSPCTTDLLHEHLESNCCMLFYSLSVLNLSSESESISLFHSPPSTPSPPSPSPPSPSSLLSVLPSPISLPPSSIPVPVPVPTSVSIPSPFSIPPGPSSQPLPFPSAQSLPPPSPSPFPQAGQPHPNMPNQQPSQASSISNPSSFPAGQQYPSSGNNALPSQQYQQQVFQGEGGAPQYPHYQGAPQQQAFQGGAPQYPHYQIPPQQPFSGGQPLYPSPAQQYYQVQPSPAPPSPFPQQFQAGGMQHYPSGGPSQHPGGPPQYLGGPPPAHYFPQQYPPQYPGPQQHYQPPPPPPSLTQHPSQQHYPPYLPAGPQLQQYPTTSLSQSTSNNPPPTNAPSQDPPASSFQPSGTAPFSHQFPGSGQHQQHHYPGAPPPYPGPQQQYSSIPAPQPHAQPFTGGQYSHQYLPPPPPPQYPAASSPYPAPPPSFHHNPFHPQQPSSIHNHFQPSQQAYPGGAVPFSDSQQAYPVAPPPHQHQHTQQQYPGQSNQSLYPPGVPNYPIIANNNGQPPPFTPSASAYPQPFPPSWQPSSNPFQPFYSSQDPRNNSSEHTTPPSQPTTTIPPQQSNFPAPAGPLPPPYLQTESNTQPVEVANDPTTTPHPEPSLSHEAATGTPVSTVNQSDPMITAPQANPSWMPVQNPTIEPSGNYFPTFTPQPSHGYWIPPSATQTPNVPQFVPQFTLQPPAMNQQFPSQTVDNSAPVQTQPTSPSTQEDSVC